MLYRVTARFIEDRAADFYSKLTDGSIQGQRPEGGEIVSSMRRAKIIEPGIIQWYETCYCETPLKHERETVYDRYLEDIDAVEVEERQDLSGPSFWSFLERADS